MKEKSFAGADTPIVLGTQAFSTTMKNIKNTLGALVLTGVTLFGTLGLAPAPAKADGAGAAIIGGIVGYGLYKAGQNDRHRDYDRRRDYDRHDRRDYRYNRHNSGYSYGNGYYDGGGTYGGYGNSYYGGGGYYGNQYREPEHHEYRSHGGRNWH